jgi:hypothetical protein
MSVSFVVHGYIFTQHIGNIPNIRLSNREELGKDGEWKAEDKQ